MSDAEDSGNGSCCTLPQARRAKAPDADDESPDGGLGARIYGREGCPHTRRARNALPRARFIDVAADPQALGEMLALTDGVRRIPVIVRVKSGREEVSVGFRRGS